MLKSHIYVLDHIIATTKKTFYKFNFLVYVYNIYYYYYDTQKKGTKLKQCYELASVKTQITKTKVKKYNIAINLKAPPILFPNHRTAPPLHTGKLLPFYSNHFLVYLYVSLLRINNNNKITAEN